MIKPKLQEHNTDLSTILSAIGDLPLKALVEAAAKNGKYVWKKSELLNNDIYATRTSTSNSLIWKLDAHTGRIPVISEKDLVGMRISNGSMYLQIDSESSCTWYFSSSNVFTLAYTLNKIAKTITVNSSTGGSNGTEWEVNGGSVLSVSANPIGYTVSDSATAYPDGGMQDGYWYEMVKEGASGIDFGKIRLAKSETSITINHSLGVKPSKCFLVADESSLDWRYTFDVLSTEKYERITAYRDLKQQNPTVKSTTNSVTFTCHSSTYPFNSYRDYYWVVMA